MKTIENTEFCAVECADNCDHRFACFVFREICDKSINSMRDLASHGADSGYSHITYTSDIIEVFQKYQSEIEQIVSNLADDLGETVAEMYSSAVRRKRSISDNYNGYVTYLVWSAVEIVCQGVE